MNALFILFIQFICISISISKVFLKCILYYCKTCRMFLNLSSIFYILLIFSSILMIWASNPIYAVFFFISVFLNTSVIFILFNIDFIGILLLLVYVGAIAILVLFIIMMVNLKKVENEQQTYMLISFLICLLFLSYFIYVTLNMTIYFLPEELYWNRNTFHIMEWTTMNDEYNNHKIVKKLGILMFTEYYLFLFFAGWLLLIALVGAIFLTNYKKGYSTKTQYNQLFRKNNLYNSHIL